jgi:Yos1-like
MLTNPSRDPHDQRDRGTERRPISSAECVFLLSSLSRLLRNRKANLFSPPTVGWGSTPSDPGFGQNLDQSGVKAKLINLINSTRTLMRSECGPGCESWKL